MPFLKIKHLKQTCFFLSSSFKRPERARSLWCLRAGFLLSAPLHFKCKLSIRPILEIFHLGQTCFPYMWCSSTASLRAFLVFTGKPFDKSEEMFCLTWKLGKMCPDRKPPEFFFSLFFTSCCMHCFSSKTFIPSVYNWGRGIIFFIPNSRRFFLLLP